MSTKDANCLEELPHFTAQLRLFTAPGNHLTEAPRTREAATSAALVAGRRSKGFRRFPCFFWFSVVVWFLYVFVVCLIRRFFFEAAFLFCEDVGVDLM